VRAKATSEEIYSKSTICDFLLIANSNRDGDAENAGLENAASGKVWNTASVLTLLYVYI